MSPTPRATLSTQRDQIPQPLPCSIAPRALEESQGRIGFDQPAVSSDSVPHDGDRTSDLTRQRTPGQLARYTPSSWHTVPPVHEYVYSGEQNIHLSPLHRFMRIPESGICTARWRPTMAVPVSSTTVRYNRTPPLVLNLPEESTTCHGQATECAIATLSQP